MLKKVENLFGLFMLVSCLGTLVYSFYHGYTDGLNGVVTESKPPVILHNIWYISTLGYFIIKLIKHIRKTEA